MIRQGIFLFVLLIGFFAVSAQAPIIVCDTDGDISEVDLPNSCSKTFIVNVGTSLSDITLHPNGKMYGTRFSQRRLYEVDLITGDLIELIDFGSARPVGMTAAANGKIYVSQGDTIPSRLFEIDIINNTYITKGFLANGSAGDLTWSNGEMYNASADNKLVKVDIENPENSVVIGTFNTTSEDIFSLVTSVLACDSSITYGITEDRQFFTIDLTNANTTELCDGDGARVFGATSIDEFSASETCQVSIDLDDDNSSTAVEADFNSNFNCITEEANIADTDVSIESINSIDSIVVQISSGILDGVSELLEIGSSVNIVSNNNAQQIIAVNNGSATIMNFQDFLSSLLYKNTNTPASPGNRTIEVTAYSNNESSNIATATINIPSLVNAGADGAVNFCSTDTPEDLFNSLGDNPDSGGTWSPSLNSTTGIFDPSIDAVGVYTYVLTSPCGNDSATVSVTINNAVTAGSDGAISLCSSDSIVDLINSLNDSPDVGGTWSPALNSGTGVFDPTIDNAGTYTYTIIGCNTASATVVVTLNESPNAGENSTLTLCAADASTDLLNSLGGNPQLGGTWTPTLNSGTNSFDPAIDTSGSYTYSINNGCGNDSAILIITISNVTNAGTNGTLNICTNETPVDLVNSLGGNPDDGGTWSPTLTSGTGLFNPSIDNAGTYTYAVVGCNMPSATVVVNVNQPLSAGSDGELNICTSNETVNLINSLEGSPTAGGIWTPTLNSGTNTFNPTVDVSGLYTYTVTNSCGSVSASVTVSIKDATDVNAGLDNTITISPEDDVVNLFDALGGTPDAGGVWSPILNSGTNIFDPSLDASGVYTYTVANDCNSDFAVLTVNVVEPDNCQLESLYIPNAFTPNNDGKNDKVFVRILGDYSRLDFRIYNRWGETVFETNDITIGWDGSFNGVLQSSDAYGYFVEIECGGEIVQGKGNITIIR